MAQRYPSAYYNNPMIGAAISNLSQAFFPPALSPEKQAEADYYAARTKGQIFENTGKAGLSQLFQTDPRRAVGEAAALGIANPDELGRFFLTMDPASSQGDIDRAVQAAGGAFSTTAGGQQRSLANDIQRQRMQGETQLGVQGLQNQGNLAVQGAKNTGELDLQFLKNQILNEGQVRVNPMTGAIEAVGAQQLGPGESVMIPDRPMVTAPYAPMAVGEDAVLVNPNSGAQVAQGNRTLAPGYTAYDQGRAPVTAPYAPQNVPQGNILANPNTGATIATGPAKPPSETEAIGQALSETMGAPELAGLGQAKVDPRLTNVRLPDGSTTMARETAQGLVDPATGAPFPPGTIKFGANVQGAGTDALTNSTTSLVQRQMLSATTGLDMSNRLLALAQANPLSLGTVGGIRGFAQALITSGMDAADAIGGTAAGVQRDLLNGLAENGMQNFFDPSVPQIDQLINAIAYSYAKSQNPTGEVSVKALQNALAQLQGGAFASSRDVITRIQGMRDQFANQMQNLGRLQPGLAGQLPAGPQTPVDPRFTAPVSAPAVPTGAPGAPAVETWVRDPATGQLRRAQ